MKREDIIKFFQHIATRETSHGVKNAFRFKAVLSSRKNGDICATSYCDEHPAQAPEITEETTLYPALGRQPRPALTQQLDPALTEPTSLVQVPTPAMTPELMTTTLEPEPGTAPASKEIRKSKRAKGKGRALDMAVMNQTMDQDYPNAPNLSLDPAYRIDPLLYLDPALDPSFDFHSITSFPSMTGDIHIPWQDTTFVSSRSPATTSTLMSVTLPGIDSFNPEPAQNTLHPFDLTPTSSQLKRSPRRTAEVLAREEAKQFAVDRRSRH